MRDEAESRFLGINHLPEVYRIVYLIYIKNYEEKKDD